MATWLPIKEEYRQKFNATAALNWFKNGIEGLPYGYHNFIFGWIDTEYDNFPPLLQPELVPPVLSLFEKTKPGNGAAVFNAGINMRLNTTNLTVPELDTVINQRNLTWAKVLQMVEQDDWVYADGHSMVCSSFVVEFWKNGGLFGNITSTIQGTEWTPRDIYQSEIIDDEPYMPEECKEGNMGRRYCQIMGTHQMEFPGISTVALYPYMNDHCGGEPPLYQRIPEGC